MDIKREALQFGLIPQLELFQSTSTANYYSQPTLVSTPSSLDSIDMSTYQPAARIVAFPSVTHSLAHLPNATNVANVPIHYPLSPTGYSQESEDKLRRAIASQTGSGRYSSASSVASDSGSSSSGGDYIMMGGRKSR
ncbi:hypothetical protein FRB99_008939 [Tulasnella sp. 403]|nr:hypothetical protein FRB99_008939 [Tulasnella sp. 403]